MNARYANGKIYSIRSPQTDKYYIGSTCLELCKRLYSHRKQYKSYVKGAQNYISSYELIKLEDHYIELIELCPCTTKGELLKREGELQRLHRADTVNSNIAGRGQAEYNEDNKVAISEKQKQHYLTHKDTISERMKQYNKINRESINEKQRVARLAKKDAESSDTNKTEAQEI